MITVGAFEAKTHLSSLLERVEHGEEVLITRRGKAIAKLIPAEAAERDDLEAVIAGLKQWREHATLGDLDWKELRDADRP
ncbi:MAG: type II toxin-antitoxin system prevent-host-death family antitoxin [Pseudomonadota bacterium]